jgi:hypothetical protein
MTREYTNKMLDMVDEGLFGDMHESAKQLIYDLLMWMPERKVEDFYCANYSDLEQLEEEEYND